MIRRLIVMLLAATGLLVFGASAAHAQYTPGEPGFILTPSTTTPGGQVTAIGYGCGRLQTVTISINGEVVATTTSADDEQGSFETTFKAPTTPGVYTVEARCGNIVQSSILTVQAAASQAASSGSLPATGSDSTLPLVRVGLALLMLGGLVVVLTRRRREQRV